MTAQPTRLACSDQIGDGVADLVTTTAVDTKIGSGLAFGNDAFFVRVRRRKLKGENLHRRFYFHRRNNPRTESASYDLVRAIRVDGKPRHKFIFGLGSLKTPHPPHEVLWFWFRALRKMRRRGLSEQQRRRVIAAMIRKGVRKPSKAQCKKFAAGWPIDFDLFADLFEHIAEAAE